MYTTNAAADANGVGDCTYPQATWAYRVYSDMYTEVIPYRLGLIHISVCARAYRLNAVRPAPCAAAACRRCALAILNARGRGRS